MRQLILTVLIAVALAMPARANDAIKKVISDQIKAFRADDFDTAFTFASPVIRQMFGTPERFGQMVRQGYPMVWRPAEVTWLDAERRGRELWQSVLIRDGAGALHVLDYQMIPGEDGWKINAVHLRPAPPGTV